MVQGRGMRRVLGAGLALLALGCGVDNDSVDVGDEPPQGASSAHELVHFYFWDNLGYGVQSILIDRDLDNYLLGGVARFAGIVGRGDKRDLFIMAYLPYPKDDGSHWGSEATSWQFLDLLGDSGLFITRNGAYENAAAAEEALGPRAFRADSGFVFYAKLKMTWTYKNEHISQTPITCNVLLGRYWSTDGLNNWRWALGAWGGHHLVPHGSDDQQATMSCDNGKSMRMSLRWADNDDINVWPLTSGG